VVGKLLEYVRAREIECKQEALKELQQFDRKQCGNGAGLYRAVRRGCVREAWCSNI